MGIQHEKGKEKEKEEEKKRKGETNLVMLTGFLHYCTLLSKELLLFSTVPLLVELVAPIRTAIAIRLMVSFAIHAFEDMRTWLTNIGSCSIHFLVFSVVVSSSFFLLLIFRIR